MCSAKTWALNQRADRQNVFVGSITIMLFCAQNNTYNTEQQMLEFFEVKGTDYEAGFAIGNKFKNYLQSRIIEFDEKAPHYQERIQDIENTLKNSFPYLLEEIYGRADGAEISRDSYLLMLFPELFRKSEGCTTLVVKKTDGSVLFAHNDDNECFDLDNTALIKYDMGDNYIISYTFVERLAGSAFSLNGKGMVFSSNYIFGDRMDLGNLSRYIVVRDVINSSSIDEALEKLKATNVASPFSLNMLELKTGRAINVEKDIDNVYVTEITDRYARSNHFHKKQGDSHNATADTKFRYKKANELISQLNPDTCTIDDLLSTLKYGTPVYDESIYKQYGDYHGVWVTDATLAVDTASDNFTVYDFIGKSVMKISKDGNLVSQTPMN